MGSEFEPNMEFFSNLQRASDIALARAAEAVRGDLIQSQTMPFDVGTLQNENTFVSPVADNKVRLVTQGPQARRLYFHPEYNFQKLNNPNAGGRWFDLYLPGHSKQEKFRNEYTKFLRKQLGG